MDSENKGADQLRGYREADLRLCFRICTKPVFSRRGSFVICSHGHINHNFSMATSLMIFLDKHVWTELIVSNLSAFRECLIRVHNVLQKIKF